MLGTDRKGVILTADSLYSSAVLCSFCALCISHLWNCCLQWGDGALIVAGCQIPTKTVLSPPFSCVGERKCNGKLRSQDKDRERSFINYCHGQNRHGEIRLIYYQSYQSRAMRKPNKTLLPHPFPFPRPSFTHKFSTSSTPPQWCRGTGNGGCDQFITHCFCCTFLLRGRNHCFCLLQHGMDSLS